MAVKNDFQFDFFRKMEGLLLGSHHSASYKFALVLALTDYSYQSGLRDDRLLEIPFEELTKWFLSYYWPMTDHYQYQGKEVQLKQGFKVTAVMNNKRQGLIQYREAHPDIRTFEKALKRSDFKPVLSKSRSTITRFSFWTQASRLL